MNKYHLTAKSANVKTGPIPVSTTSAATCPPECPFNNSQGCYAGSGPLALHWAAVTRGDRGDCFADFCDKIAAQGCSADFINNQLIIKVIA